MNPEDLNYTREHEWIRETDEVVRFGITDFAQDSLGDIVYVSLPEVGDRLTAGEPCGEVESTKSVSDVYAPASGEVTAINENLDDDPSLVNADPYGAGWLVELRPSDSSADLMDADEYEEFVNGL